MNQGAREANDENRHYSEAQHRERVIELLREIRDAVVAIRLEVQHAVRREDR